MKAKQPAAWKPSRLWPDPDMKVELVDKLLTKAARDLGRRRWVGKTAAERSAHGKMMAERKAAKEKGR